MHLVVAGLAGLAVAGVAGVVSVVVAGRWYERVGEPAVGVSGPEYARRLLDGTGYAVEEDAWAESSHCDYRRKKVVLTPGCWGPGLRAVLIAAHEAGHARFDRGPAVWLAAPRARFLAALAWLAAVLLGGVLRLPVVAAAASVGGVLLAADRFVREARACLFARDAVRRDFPGEAGRAWAEAYVRAGVLCAGLVSAALALLFASVAAILYAFVSGRLVRSAVLPPG